MAQIVLPHLALFQLLITWINVHMGSDLKSLLEGGRGHILGKY